MPECFSCQSALVARVLWLPECFSCQSALVARVAIAALIPAFFDGDVPISRSLSAGWMSSGWIPSVSLKCSVHLRSCSSSLVSSLPSLPMTGG